MINNIEVEVTLFDGLPVIAVGDYSFGHPGQVYGPPEACFPPEPSEFDFELFWPGKPGDKRLCKCNRKLTAEDEELIYQAADDYMANWYDEP